MVSKTTLKHLFSTSGFYWLVNYLFITLRPLHVIPARLHLKIMYRCSIGKKLHLNNPQSFNEKLSWQKLYDHNPVYSRMVDKYDAKAIASAIIGQEYIVPCYGVWNSFDEIDFDKLPNQFILKATHDSSSVVPCYDKSSFDLKMAKAVIDRGLKTDYYQNGYEWPYKNASRRVLADELLIDGERKELQDYKWWCFNGEPKVMYITNKGAFQKCEENFYDMNFKPLDINHGFPRTIPEYKKPEQFDKMRELAGKLAQKIPFCRIDFFVINNRIYFGEFTFFDHAGLRPFTNDEWDMKLGSWINLPRK